MKTSIRNTWFIEQVLPGDMDYTNKRVIYKKNVPKDMCVSTIIFLLEKEKEKYFKAEPHYNFIVFVGRFAYSFDREGSGTILTRDHKNKYLANVPVSEEMLKEKLYIKLIKALGKTL